MAAFANFWGQSGSCLMKRVNFIFLLLIAGQQIWCQEISRIHYTIKDGLPGPTVYQCLQDRRGFIWFATNTGVSRFDGRQFRNYNKEDGLPDNEIVKMYLDSHDDVWFMSFSGVPSVYSNGKITSFKNLTGVNIVLEDRQTGSILLYSWQMINAMGALGIYTSKNQPGKWNFSGQLNPFEHYNDFLKVELLRASTASGFNFYLNRNNTNLNTIKIKHANREDRYIVPGRNTDYVLQGQKFISTITHNDSALVFIADDSVYMASQYFCKGLFSLGTFDLPGIQNKGIISIYEENDSTLWLSSKDKGALCVHNYASANRKFSFLLPKTFCTSFLKDREGGYWISTYTDGVFYFPNIRFFYFAQLDKEVKCIRALSPGKIVAGVANGQIFQCAPPYNTMNVSDPNNENRNNRILDMAELDKNKMVFATNNGLYIQDGNIWRNVAEKFGSIKGIYAYKDSILVLAAPEGIFTYDLKTRQANLIFYKRTFCVNGIGNRYFWGCNDGLYEYQNGKTIYWGGKDAALREAINHVDIAPDSTIWVSTVNGIVIIKGYEILQHIQKKDGLPGNAYRSVAFDKQSALISTDKGICRINIQPNDGLPKPLVVSTITQEDGLLSEDVNQVVVCNGLAWAATARGICFFPADYKQTASIPPTIEINSLSVAQQKKEVTDTVHLNYDENNVQVELAAISFKSGSQIVYKYKLSATDTNWNTTFNNKIDFSSLPFGIYHFTAEAVDRWGKHSNPATLVISHPAPYWKKAWFVAGMYVFGGILLALIFTLAYRRFRKKREEEFLMRKKMVDYEIIALKSQMNPHFVFNCLNSIQHYILQNDVEKANFYLYKFSMLVRRILQNSTVPYVSLAEEITTLDLYLQLEKMRFNDKMNYSIITKGQIDSEGIMVPPMIIQPYVENAVKHGISPLLDRQGEITVQFMVVEETLICTIKDNGVGIKSYKNKLADTKNHKSMGLKMTQDRIEAINALMEDKIRLAIIDRSDEGKGEQGTLVTISFPVVKD